MMWGHLYFISDEKTKYVDSATTTFGTGGECHCDLRRWWYIGRFRFQSASIDARGAE